MWTNQLPPHLADQVLALAARAAVVDDTEPLNEEARFALRDDRAGHLLHVVGDDLAGYLQWQGSYRTAQLVVDPQHRRRGIGRRLVGTLRQAQRTNQGAPATTHPEDWGVWAFGDLQPARGFAAALGLRPARGLLVMERPLTAIEPPTAAPGLTLRGYRPDDAAALLAVNAAAFAHHPEQGALDRAGLDARMGEPWFDPAGLILGVDAEGLAGFHWTKRVGSAAEVYVIGVAPRAQGRGYGRVLLQAGLAHLAHSGADHVVLYVDTAEPVAVRMYESAGFHVAHSDVLYAPDRQEQP